MDGWDDDGFGPDEPFARECGETRVAGGLYLEMKTGPGGVPMMTYCTCPTLPISGEEQAQMGLTAQGMCVVNYTGSDGKEWSDVYDWIGVDHYEVWDWLMECRAAPSGMSRHINRTDTALLEALAKPGFYVAVSPHGSLLNAAEFYERRCENICAGGEWGNEEHVTPRWQAQGQTCISLLRETFTSDEELANPPGSKPDDQLSPASEAWRRRFLREHPEFAATYTAYKAPEGVAPEWQLAEFYRLPKRYLNLTIVNDPGNPEDVAATMERVKQHAAGVSVRVAQN
jgi:hypothetical protein